MLLSNLLNIFFVASLALAGPIPGREKDSSESTNPSSSHSPNDLQIVPWTGTNAVTNGIMRFGVELEQVYRIKKDAHPKLQAVMKEYEDLYTKNDLDFNDYIHTRAKINKIIATEWKNWDPKRDPNFNKAVQVDKHFEKYEMFDLTDYDGDRPVDLLKVWSITDDGSLEMDGKLPPLCKLSNVPQFHKWAWLTIF